MEDTQNKILQTLLQRAQNIYYPYEEQALGGLAQRSRFLPSYAAQALAEARGLAQPMDLSYSDGMATSFLPTQSFSDSNVIPQGLVPPAIPSPPLPLLPKPQFPTPTTKSPSTPPPASVAAAQFPGPAAPYRQIFSTDPYDIAGGGG